MLAAGKRASEASAKVSRNEASRPERWHPRDQQIKYCLETEGHWVKDRRV